MPLNMPLIRILWKQFLGLSVNLSEGFQGNVTFVNIDLLPRMDKLKLTCKNYEYVLLWNNKEVIVVINIFVRSAAKYDVLYPTDSLASVIFFD